jgi:tRNA G18 (ribose-2'-O)-methylase SpoU
MRDVILVVSDVRSAHNVGSLLRTADGLGLKRVILTGYTPYPISASDDRLPHLARKAHAKIQKTALGAEESVGWERDESVSVVLEKLSQAGYEIAALEQSADAISLAEYRPPGKVALIVGSEVGGVDAAVLNQADVTLEIPMRGRKESFNVSAAAAMALYHLTTLDNSTA